MNFINNFLDFMWGEENIRDCAVSSLTKIVSDYSDWYDEQGLFLPPDYATDPAGWSEALHKIKRALSLLDDEMRGQGELWDAKTNPNGVNESEVQDLEKEIKEGLTLLGSQLFYLTDPKKGVAKGH